MLLQISYKTGEEVYLDVFRVEMNANEKAIWFVPEYLDDDDEDNWKEIKDEEWDNIKTIYINNRIAYARPYDRGLGAEL